MLYPKIDLSALQSVLKTVVLFDSLNVPVSKSAIEHYLIESSASIEGIEISLSILEDLELIKNSESGYYLFAREFENLKKQNPTSTLSFFQKIVLGTISSFSFLRGVYQLNVPGIQEAIILDVSGLNNPRKAKLLCKCTALFLGQPVLFVSRFKKVDTFTTLLDLSLAGMKPLYNAHALEKLIKRHPSNISVFPNRVVDSKTEIGPYFNKLKGAVKKPVFNAIKSNDAELFTWLEAQNNNLKFDERWASNQTVFRQWLLPKLSKLNRKYHLV